MMTTFSRRLNTPQRQVADARTRFLTDDEVDGINVRDAIVESWRRSQNCNVHADRVEVRYVGSPDLETQLSQSATPLLRQLVELLSDEPVSVILTDPVGVVLARYTKDVALERHLDRVNLAPGFTYAECEVGTNGIGTALDRRNAFSVLGSEHYAEGLADLACFGAPIRHPISHKTIGLLDLTCWNRRASSFLAALTTTTAARIEESILTASGQRESALLNAYIAACRRTNWPVLATNNDVMMMNAAARSTLGPDDHSLVLALTAEAGTSGLPQKLPVKLANVTAQLECTAEWTMSGLAGYVITVRFDAPARLGPECSSRATRPLPGLAGSSPIWVRCCDDARRAYQTGRPLLLLGEPGVGKLALADAIHRDHSPAVFAQVHDARDAETTPGWLDSVQAALSAKRGPVILRRLDQLPEPSRPDLVSDQVIPPV